MERRSKRAKSLAAGLEPPCRPVAAGAEATDRPRQGFLVFHFFVSVLFFVSRAKKGHAHRRAGDFVDDRDQFLDGRIDDRPG